MNRSILVVICDFIITSMIYLNGGFSALESQPHDGRPADRTTVNIIASELEAQRAELEKTRARLLQAGPAANQQELDRITRELALTRAKLEQIRRQGELTEQNSGAMTPSDVRREINEEIFQKHLAQERYALLQQQLQLARSTQQELRAESTRAHREAARLDERLTNQQIQFEQKLSEKERELQLRAARLRQQETRLAEQARRLDEARRRLEQSDRDLAVSRRELAHARSERDQARQSARQSEQARNEQIRVSQATTRNLRSELRKSEDRRESAEREIAVRRSELEQALAREQELNRQLARTRDERNRAVEQVKQVSAQRDSSNRNVVTMKHVVADSARRLDEERKRIAAERKRLQAERDRLQQENIRLRADSAKLRAVEKELDFFKTDLAQKNHAESLTEFALQWEQYRAVGRNRIVAVKNFLPVFQLGGRNYVASTLEVLGGKQENSSTPRNIISLEYKVGKPGTTPARVVSPIRVAADDCRIAMMDVTGLKGVKPLKLITWDELRQRGSLDFYLFKHDSMRNAKLENRISWGPGNDRYVYVTNNPRAGNELKAQAGDLLLTRQGEFAGVVVSVKGDKARCYIFSALPDTSRMPRIDQGTPQSKFQEFITGMSLFWQKGEELTARQP